MRDELRAAKILQERLKELPNVEILWNHIVTEIKGKDQVEGMVLQNTKENTRQEKEIDGIFIAVGIRPNTVNIEGMPKMDENGYIEAGEDGRTSIDGIFAAGDVRTKRLRQIITAVADGANAVTSVQEYILLQTAD